MLQYAQTHKCHIKLIQMHNDTLNTQLKLYSYHSHMHYKQHMQFTEIQNTKTSYVTKSLYKLQNVQKCLNKCHMNLK